jgi:hypothetical protein
MGELMSVQEVVVERNVRRRRNRQPSAGTKRAATLFRIWHGVREMIEEAESLGDGELVHFLAVAQTLIEEKTDPAGFAEVDTSLPN